MAEKDMEMALIRVCGDVVQNGKRKYEPEVGGIQRDGERKREMRTRSRRDPERWGMEKENAFPK